MRRFPAAVAGCLVAALAATADPPRAPDRALRPDPKAKPAPADLAGVWVAEQAVPNGYATRYHVVRFLDADTAVWTIAQHSPGVRASSTLRGRYELANGEFRLHVAERYAGDEPQPVRDADKKVQRAFRFAWDGPQKAGFTLVAPDAAPDSPWRTTVFRKGADAPAAAPDPLTPKALLTIDRTIAKEPRYGETPLYLLLAFGPDSADRVWAVLDGTVLYLDKNGNGDLTDEGERVFALALPGDGVNRRNPLFQVPLLETKGGKHTDFFLSAIRLAPGDGVYVKMGVKVNGTTAQHAGPTDLRLAETPAAARVLAFGSRVVTAQVSHTMPGVPEVDKAIDFRVRVGTPGVGLGSFVGFGSEDQVANPVAEFEFPAAAPGTPAKRLVVPLTERCCGDQFYAAVTAPDGSKAGLGAAAVTLSYPKCPWGPVAPTTTRIDVAPKAR